MQFSPIGWWLAALQTRTLSKCKVKANSRMMKSKKSLQFGGARNAIGPRFALTWTIAI
jgi:hypothetical protein